MTRSRSHPARNLAVIGTRSRVASRMARTMGRGALRVGHERHTRPGPGHLLHRTPHVDIQDPGTVLHGNHGGAGHGLHVAAKKLHPEGTVRPGMRQVGPCSRAVEEEPLGADQLGDARMRPVLTCDRPIRGRGDARHGGHDEGAGQGFGADPEWLHEEKPRWSRIERTLYLAEQIGVEKKRARESKRPLKQYSICIIFESQTGIVERNLGCIHVSLWNGGPEHVQAHAARPALRV